MAPAWRRRGVGRELLRRLLRATSAPCLPAPGPLARAARPDSVAAFPPPDVRPFFACVHRAAFCMLAITVLATLTALLSASFRRCGFRRDPRYLWMRLGDGSPAEPLSGLPVAEREAADDALIEPSDDVAAAMTALWTPLPGARRSGSARD